MTHDEMLAVIEHHKNGGTVEARLRGSAERWRVAPFPNWMFGHYEYRIKKEPVVLWGIIWEGGSVSSTNFRSRKGAEAYTKGMFPGRVIKMVEVEE